MTVVSQQDKAALERQLREAEAQRAELELEAIDRRVRGDPVQWGWDAIDAQRQALGMSPRETPLAELSRKISTIRAVLHERCIAKAARYTVKPERHALTSTPWRKGRGQMMCLLTHDWRVYRIIRRTSRLPVGRRCRRCKRREFYDPERGRWRIKGTSS